MFSCHSVIVAGTDSQVVIYYLKAYLLGLIFNYFFYTTFDWHEPMTPGPEVIKLFSCST